MKCILPILALILTAPLFGQGVRIDLPLRASGPNVPVSGGPLPQSLILANAKVSICTHPAPSIGACAPATTYTDATMTTPCPTSAPIVQLPGSACVSTTGVTGNLGFWYAGGNVDYFVQGPYGTQGPFTTSGGTTGPTGPTGPQGPAGGQTPAGPAFAVNFANAGVTNLQGDPTYTFNPTAHSLAVNIAQPAISPVADITNPAYGAVGDGSHDDAPALRAAMAGLKAAGTTGTVYLPRGTYNLASSADGSDYLLIDQDHTHIVCAPGSKIVTTGQFALFFFGPANGVVKHPIMNKAGFQANVLTNAGSSTITLTTPSDTSHFSVGDPIYILGGPGTESNGDGEINWLTAIDTVGGVLTLRVPTSKPYTGNLTGTGALQT